MKKLLLTHLVLVPVVIISGTHLWSQPRNSVSLANRYEFEGDTNRTNATSLSNSKAVIVIDTLVARFEKPVHDPVPSSHQGGVGEMDQNPVIALRAIFHQNSILFDYREYELTAEAKYVLDKVAKVMLSHPEVVFQLSGHTDARGLYHDNIRLANRRVESTRKYLINKGVRPDQLVTLSCGETYLINECDSDSECSEGAHAVNRRVEIHVKTIPKTSVETNTTIASN